MRKNKDVQEAMEIMRKNKDIQEAMEIMRKIKIFRRPWK